MGRPQRTDYPITVKASRCAAGFIGVVRGHQQEILWECVPHHQAHNSQAMARQCAYEELERGRAAGRYL